MISAIVDILGWRGVILAGLLVGASAWGGLQWAGKVRAETTLANERAAHAIAQSALQKQAKDRYEALTKRMSTIGTGYEDKLTKIEGDRDQLRVDLRTAKRKLQDYLTCPAPGPGASAASVARFNENARLREESTAETIADADRADAWIIGLQDTIRAYQDGRMAPRQK